MRVTLGDLDKYKRAVPPAPPPIEPLLPPAEEARRIAHAQPDDREAQVRRERVVTLIRRPAAPEGADAELVVLFAARRALPLPDRDDRLLARMRLTEIGRAKDPPPEVQRMLRRFEIEPGDGPALADRLLPPSRPESTFYESGVGMVFPPANGT